MKKTMVITGVLITGILGVIFYAMTEPDHLHHGHQDGRNHQTSDTPKEAGQGAFAAIAEIVSLLENDPDTDWSNVNIRLLRDHLVDMNQLVLEAEVDVIDIQDGVEFQISGSGTTLRAIHNMVPAHAKELARIDGWDVSATNNDSGVVLTIITPVISELIKIKALGFFGLMGTGSHHQPHHFAMSTGQLHNH